MRFTKTAFAAKLENSAKARENDFNNDARRIPLTIDLVFCKPRDCEHDNDRQGEPSGGRL